MSRCFGRARETVGILASFSWIVLFTTLCVTFAYGICHWDRFHFLWSVWHDKLLTQVLVSMLATRLSLGCLVHVFTLSQWFLPANTVCPPACQHRVPT